MPVADGGLRAKVGHPRGPAKVAEPEPAPTPVGPGTLRIGSSPHWARISIDGAVRGTTPLVLSISAGPHQVVATNPDLGRSETRRVSVLAGGVTSLRFDPF
jgi:hypothetical protein